VKRKEKNRVRSVRHLAAVALPALLLALVLAGGYFGGTYGWQHLERFAKTSSLFSLKEVHIQGNRNVTEEEILRAAGLSFGANLLAIDLQILRARLLANPLIRNASVRRRLPSEVVVEVEERVPAAEIRGDRRFVVDGDGHVMTVAREDLPLALPCLSGMKVSDGKVVGEDMDDLLDGIEIVRTIRAVGFPALEDIECIDLAAETDAVIVPAGGGTLVHVGREDVFTRLRRLMLVAPDITARWEEVEYIDLRSDGLVVTRPVASPVEGEEDGDEG
jgi:cell division protein FtsQ